MGVLEYKEEDDILARIRKDLADHSAAYREWRVKARESYDFVASEQWTDEEKQALQDSMRTPIVFNRVARTINAVQGLELQNRQEVTFKPVSNKATQATDLMNQAVKWARSSCDAEDEESEAFADVLTCGVGATESMMDYSTDLDGMIVVERVDPFECAADHLAKKRNFDDARWVARWKGYTKEEFERLYPDFEPEGKDLVDWDNTDKEIEHSDDEYKYDDGSESRNDKAYIIVKYQYYCDKTVYRVAMPDGLKTLTEEEYSAVKSVLESQGIKSIAQKQRSYKQVLACRDTVLEETDCPIEAFTIRFITGLRDRNRNIWFGLVELMKDPQRWANKWLSQIQFILNSNAKGGIIHEANVFTNPKKAKADWAKPNAWIEVVKGTITEGRIKDRTPPMYPDGIDRLLQQALTAINDVPGVNVELLGLADRNQPGVVEDGRKNAGVTILASFFDALRRYRKENGRVLMKFVIDYISDGRLIRLDNMSGQFAPLLRDGLAEKYDILVDDAPTSPNMKEKTFGAVSQMLGVALQAGIPIPPEILEYSPLPAELVGKWMELIKNQQSGDPEKEQMKATIAQMQDEMKLMVGEINNKQAEAAAKVEESKLKYSYEQAKLEFDAAQLQLDRQKAANDAENDKAKIAGELLLKTLDAKMKALEIELNAIQRVEPIREESNGEEEAMVREQQDILKAQLIIGAIGEIKASLDGLTAAVEKPKTPVYDEQGNIISVN